MCCRGHGQICMGVSVRVILHIETVAEAEDLNGNM